MLNTFIWIIICLIWFFHLKKVQFIFLKSLKLRLLLAPHYPFWLVILNKAFGKSSLSDFRCLYKPPAGSTKDIIHFLISWWWFHLNNCLKKCVLQNFVLSCHIYPLVNRFILWPFDLTRLGNTGVDYYVIKAEHKVLKTSSTLTSYNNDMLLMDWCNSTKNLVL